MGNPDRSPAVKLAGDLIAAGNSEKQAKEILIKEYYLSSKKAELLMSVRGTDPLPGRRYHRHNRNIYRHPFCPTRCVYCSFPSNQVGYDKIKPYLGALKHEIRFAGEALACKGWYPETIYIGGGTPTVLEDADIERLLKAIRESFYMKRLRELTVEAGRPDTITESKLIILKENGVDRISINPQSMKQETLEKIGRCHCTSDVFSAFGMARNIGFKVINADLIAGLPGEEKDFLNSLETVIGLSPQNITVHTLAVKRASRLKDIDDKYSYRQGEKVS